MKLILAEQSGDSPDGRQWGFLISQETTRQEELTGFAVISFEFETNYVQLYNVHASTLISKMLDLTLETTLL